MTVPDLRTLLRLLRAMGFLADSVDSRIRQSDIMKFLADIGFTLQPGKASIMENLAKYLAQETGVVVSADELGTWFKEPKASKKVWTPPEEFRQRLEHAIRPKGNLSQVKNVLGKPDTSITDSLRGVMRYLVAAGVVRPPAGGKFLPINKMTQSDVKTVFSSLGFNMPQGRGALQCSTIALVTLIFNTVQTTRILTVKEVKAWFRGPRCESGVSPDAAAFVACHLAGVVAWLPVSGTAKGSPVSASGSGPGSGSASLSAATTVSATANMNSLRNATTASLASSASIDKEHQDDASSAPSR